MPSCTSWLWRSIAAFTTLRGSITRQGPRRGCWIGRKAVGLRTGHRNNPSLFSEESGGLGLAKSKSFVHSANKTMFFDNLPLEITCSKCGRLIKETVKWLKAENRKCPFCDTPIDTTEFRRGIDEATNRTHEMLRNLQGSLSSVKIKIKL